MVKSEIIKNVEKIDKMYKKGFFGSPELPEDSNPHLNKSSEENALYFTLPTALNYQRNSYQLWENALKTYNDPETIFLFNPKEVVNRNFEDVQMALTKYRLALQKNKQTKIWLKLCRTFLDDFNGSIYNFFSAFDNDIEKVRYYMQIKAKKDFPYLSGRKLCNYWMFVIYQYTDIQLKNVNNIYIAADTHIIKASERLGLINKEQENSAKVQETVINAWSELLEKTDYSPIDFQTSLWMWARNDFPLVAKVANGDRSKN